MSTRICPNCNTFLGEFDNFFCSACGTELPEKVSKLSGTLKIREFYSLQPLFSLSKKKKITDEPLKKKADKQDESNSITEKTKSVHKKSFNEKMSFILVFVILGLVVLFSGLYFYLKSRPIPQQKSAVRVQQNYKKNVNLGLLSKPVNFSSLSGQDYAPAESVLYVDVADFNYFHENVLSSDLLDMEVGDYVALKTLVKPEGFSMFVFKYEGKPYWVAVFSPTDSTTLIKDLENRKSPRLKARVIEDKLVVFQNNAPENVIKTVEGVKKGQILKVSLNPEYVKAVAQLQPTGQMRVILLNGEESSIIVSQLAEKYFGSKSDLFSKLLNIKETSFVVNK